MIDLKTALLIGGIGAAAGTGGTYAWHEHVTVTCEDPFKAGQDRLSAMRDADREARAATLRGGPSGPHHSPLDFGR